MEATERPWRLGRHYGMHVYAQSPTTPEHDDPVATFFNTTDAERAVMLHNAALANLDVPTGLYLLLEAVRDTKAALIDAIPYIRVMGRALEDPDNRRTMVLAQEAWRRLAPILDQVPVETGDGG